MDGGFQAGVRNKLQNLSADIRLTGCVAIGLISFTAVQRLTSLA